MAAPRTHPRTVAALLLAGLALFALIVQAEWLLVPAGAQSISALTYRIAFFIHLPIALVINVFIPRQGHQWPLWIYFSSSLVMPFVYYGCWRAIRALATPRADSAKASGNANPANVSRRNFLIRTTGGAGTLFTVGFGAYATCIEPQRLQVRHYEIAIRDLPATLHGFRIIHVSDTHYGPFIPMPFLKHTIETANALNADVIFLTGDYVHRTPRSIAPGVQALRNLKSRLGAVGVLGNHDHWEDADACRENFIDIGIPLIDNHRTFLTARGWRDEPSPDAICIGGVGDLWTDEVLIDRALADAPQSMPRLLLSHNPDVAETHVAQNRVDLMFAGHTHGGQVSLPRIGAPLVPSRYGQKYAGGLCQGPHCPVLVSRGVGMAIFPVRFGVRPEIATVTLIPMA